MAGKQETISFKVDPALADIIRRVPNRSDFIRKAIMNALENTCPLCQGSGIITPEQKPHWEKFLKSHDIVKCAECDAVYIECHTAEGDPDEQKDKG